MGIFAKAERCHALMRAAPLVVLFCCFCSGLWGATGCTGCGPTLSGVVVDGAGLPVPGARVRLQAQSASVLTGSSGAFTLAAPSDKEQHALTASKEGFFNAGVKLGVQPNQYRLVLLPVETGDDPQYPFQSAFSAPQGQKQEKPACAACHPQLVDEWERSAHAGSARNPLFLAAFEGVDRHGQATLGPAYKLDFPDAQGNCATCHLPVAALKSPFGSNPLAASGVEAEGVGCDFCHKVRDAAVDPTGGRPGVLSFKLGRPPPDGGQFFGPLDDVIAGSDSFASIYRDSRYCAPCHNGSFWNVLAYSEYSEWAESGYARRGIQCQSCHMKDSGGPRRIALEQEGAVVRQPSTLSSHLQFGLNDESFMKGALKLSSEVARIGDTLKVTVSVTNARGGHHLPTGSPMRNMILVVEAVDARGRPLALLSGSRVPDWAGGDEPGRKGYAGLPGKGFAKILAGLVEYSADRRQGRHFTQAFPAPYWRPTVLVSDTRIPAETMDSSRYVFAWAQHLEPPVRIRSVVIYRRTFRTWGRLDEVKAGELELASLECTIHR